MNRCLRCQSAEQSPTSFYCAHCAPFAAKENPRAGGCAAIVDFVTSFFFLLGVFGGVAYLLGHC